MIPYCFSCYYEGRCVSRHQDCFVIPPPREGETIVFFEDSETTRKRYQKELWDRKNLPAQERE